MKILQDSHNLTSLSILLNLLSTLSFVGVFYQINTDKSSDLFKHFDHTWHYSQYMLCAFFFMMAMWPINNFFQFLSSTHKSNEDRVNLYKKEDENPEAD